MPVLAKRGQRERHAGRFCGYPSRSIRRRGGPQARAQKSLGLVADFSVTCPYILYFFSQHGTLFLFRAVLNLAKQVILSAYDLVNKIK